MIRHIVMWKLKPEAEGHTAAENARWMKEHLEGLMGVVPELRSCEVGLNIQAGNFDACLVSTFDSMEDLDAYKVNPAHVAISEYCNKVRETRVACDYLVQGHSNERI